LPRLGDLLLLRGGQRLLLAGVRIGGSEPFHRELVGGFELVGHGAILSKAGREEEERPSYSLFRANAIRNRRPPHPRPLPPLTRVERVSVSWESGVRELPLPAGEGWGESAPRRSKRL